MGPRIGRCRLVAQARGYLGLWSGWFIVILEGNPKGGQENITDRHLAYIGNRGNIHS